MKRLSLVFVCALVMGMSGPAAAQVDDAFDALGKESNSTAEVEAERKAKRDAKQRERDAARESAEAAARGNLAGPGDWGLGAVQTPSGVRGLEVEYYLRKLMISTVVGFQKYTPEVGEALTVVGFGAGAFYSLRSASNTAFMVGGRLVVGYASVAEVSATQLNLEAPLRLQWHPTRRLSLHFETGLVLSLIPEQGEVVGVAPGFGRAEGVSVRLGTAGLLGSAGMTVYF